MYNQIKEGVDKGASVGSAMDLIGKQGCITLSDMHYNELDYMTQPNYQQTERATMHKSAYVDNSYYEMTKDITTMKAAIAVTGGVLLSIPVYKDFDCLSAKDPVYDNKQLMVITYSKIFLTKDDWFNNTSKQRIWPPDVNGDGYDDLLGIAFEGSVYWAKSNGNGTFERAIPIVAYTYSTDEQWFDKNYKQRIWPADVNGDGKAEILGSHTNGYIYISINYSNKIYWTYPMKAYGDSKFFEE